MGKVDALFKFILGLLFSAPPAKNALFCPVTKMLKSITVFEKDIIKLAREQ